MKKYYIQPTYHIYNIEFESSILDISNPSVENNRDDETGGNLVKRRKQSLSGFGPSLWSDMNPSEK